MKKLKKLLLISIITFTSFVFSHNNIQADDDAYYYKNIHVDVNITEERVYEITEELTVYFNEERRGIIRTIPFYSDVETYIISDVSVEGAPYTTSDDGGIAIRIGDPNKTVTGEQKYIIKYRLKHYQDYEENADFVYINLIGREFDTRIENFSAKITYPENAIWEKTTVTSGYFGSTDNEYVEYSQSGNVISMQSLKTIGSFSPITLQVQLAEGTFSKAPEYKFSYVVNNVDIEIDVTKEKEYLVTRRYEITNNESTSKRIFLTSDFFNYGEDSKISDFKCSDEFNCELSSTGYFIYLTLPLQDTYTFDISYKIRPSSVHQSKTIRWELVDFSDDAKTLNYRVKINFPFDVPFYQWVVGRYNDNYGQDDFFETTTTSNSIEFVGSRMMTKADRFEIKIEVNNNLFSRPLSMSVIISVGISVILSLIFIFLRLTTFSKKKIIPVVEFYPPDGINSVEAGYLIDDKLQNTDISSIIFYWASKGYLRIKEEEKNKFQLIRLIEPVHVSEYEENLFDNMFNCGDGEAVMTDELSGTFYVYLNSAKKTILKKYKSGQYEIWDSSFSIMKILATIAAIIPLIAIFASLDALLGPIGEILRVSVFLTPFFPLIVVFIIKMIRNPQGKDSVSLMICIMFTVAIFLLPISIMLPSFPLEIIITCIISIVCIIVMTICARGFKKRTTYGNDILGRLHGFKEFIKTAEKERIEMLLESDPEYYYHILPYANVLGVTKIWQKKFEHITMEPPSWYDSTMPYTHQSFMKDFSRASNSFALSSTPPVRSYSSSGGSSGSGYSGGGGGYSGGSSSGGGSSGGGSGGGGSSSW